MSKITHPDTYTCDMCNHEFNEDDIELCKNVQLPVLFTSEQVEEGCSCDPYFDYVHLDICRDCLAKAVNTTAAGTMNHIKYGHLTTSVYDYMIRNRLHYSENNKHL